MKKLFTLTFALAALTVFVSCGEDDAPFGENELVIGEEVIPLFGNYYYDSDRDLTNGLDFRTEGASVTTHVRRYITFTDDIADDNAYVRVELYSKGTTFKNGTFTVKSYNDQVNADTESFAIITVEFYGEEYNFYGFESTSGTVTISSNVEEVDMNDMTLKFNLAGVAEVPVSARQNGPSEEVNVNVKGQFRGEIQVD